MKFFNMGSKAMSYPVRNGSKVVIPEGATGVKIAFRQSHLKRFDEVLQRWVSMNVYIYKGRVIHA